MSRLFITADVHGNYSVWQKLLSKLLPDDVLVIAGDFFGNRFPDANNPGYQPETLRQEYLDLPNQKYFVYGNCDIPGFFPNQSYGLSFLHDGKQVFVFHGDSNPPREKYDIVISGHTHVSGIQNLDGALYINPGSPARPKDEAASYAVYQNGKAEIIKI